MRDRRDGCGSSYGTPEGASRLQRTTEGGTPHRNSAPRRRLLVSPRRRGWVVNSPAPKTGIVLLRGGKHARRSGPARTRCGAAVTSELLASDESAGLLPPCLSTLAQQSATQPTGWRSHSPRTLVSDTCALGVCLTGATGNARSGRAPRLTSEGPRSPLLRIAKPDAERDDESKRDNDSKRNDTHNVDRSPSRWVRASATQLGGSRIPRSVTRLRSLCS